MVTTILLNNNVMHVILYTGDNTKKMFTLPILYFFVHILVYGVGF